MLILWTTGLFPLFVVVVIDTTTSDALMIDGSELGMDLWHDMAGWRAQADLLKFRKAAGLSGVFTEDPERALE